MLVVQRTNRDANQIRYEIGHVAWSLSWVCAVGCVALLAAFSGSAVVGALNVEVKQHNGAPALFINGKPQTGLMFWTTDPAGKAAVRNGRMELEHNVGSQLVQTKPLASERLVS